MILNNYLTSMKVLVIGLFLLFGSATCALAQEPDTSTADLEFTEIAPETTPKADTAIVAPATTITDTTKATKVISTVVKPNKTEMEKTLWETFIAGLVGGFLAFLMPCIFPMVPLTISYFTKRAGSQSKGVGQALIYGLSIIVIYVAFGLLITVIFGSAGLNALSASGLFNFLFFILLVAFAISFFGAFEITLPSSIVNKIDNKADNSKGLGGIFFMAASLALVSFSCTGPIIGTLLVQASSKGELLAPAIGMFGFALALALPFTLSAVFPGFLSSMPKSGGWLNSVKVCLGFLELALALKFLSSADLAWHWEWFDREIFLALWIVIFILMGIYLLGKIKFSHDSDVPYVSVPRLFFAILSFSFAMYMVPGLWGAPVSILSGLAPPTNTQDFILSGNGSSASSVVSADFPAKVKYSESLKAPVGFHPFFDLDEGLEYAKKVNKPVLLDFTGHTCVNCRRMEDLVWVDKEVARLINEEYVLIQLYADDRNIKMPAEKVHYSDILKRNTDDLGYWNLDFQATKYGSNAQPLYVLAGQDLTPLVPVQGANFNVKEYADYLRSGLAVFKKK
ncbi:MAG: cytochrome c biogenesis protein CcdA [Candidatus Pedobacter colombiensis]|uniref:Cytochrome c biogenesis protein CcdA n=1 Tax=Candidatus Pedobacter colombiensis TaxID=3121371 RepID=A0AAJ5WDI0_9SPHI|nr:cytochrome c biogenesis protein CcdA [Pedobacter sp.]WEK21535.1 MAG: cytochrome c biogenesis protein CcdA [Pedobacter sp.]